LRSVRLCTASGQTLEGTDALLDADARGRLDAGVHGSTERIGEEETGAGRGEERVTLTAVTAVDVGGSDAARDESDIALRLRCALLAT
jgi:hypothetical protein